MAEAGRVLAEEEAETGTAARAAEREEARERLRRYTHLVTVALIVICNTIFLLVIYGSGVNLETLLKTPDVFNPSRDVCLRQSWHKVTGLERPVRLCYEWINLSDPTGETHTFQSDTEVVRGADGHLYFDHGLRTDYRLLLFVAFVAALVVSGIAVKRYLIIRYRARLGLAGHKG